MSRPPAALLFDLDGTLVDSRRDLAAALNRVRNERGLPDLQLAAVEAMVGEGARALVRKALAPEGEDGEEGAERLDDDLALFLARYEELLLETTRPYPGVPELLVRLAARFPLGVLTNKPEGLSRRILAGLGLIESFRIVIGGDTLPVRKPDPAVVVRAAAALGAAVPELLLIGDSRVDVEAARRAGCRLALVGWGYEAPEALRGADAELVAQSPGELWEALLGGPL